MKVHIKKELVFCFPKEYIEKYYPIFLDKKPIEIKTNVEKIKFKLFLERVYLLYFIYCISVVRDIYQEKTKKRFQGVSS